MFGGFTYSRMWAVPDVSTEQQSPPKQWQSVASQKALIPVYMKLQSLKALFIIENGF